MSATPTRSRALAQLRRWLGDGTLDGGTGLPGEVALAARLGVARGTVRLALQQLAQEGLVTASRHRGRKVRSSAAVGDEQAVVVIGNGEDRNFQAAHEGAVEDACVRLLRAQSRPLLLVNGYHAVPARALALLGQRPCGIILNQFLINDPRWEAQAHAWRIAGIPVIMHSQDPRHAEFDRVGSDHRGATQDLVSQLIALGRRRIQPIWHTDQRPGWLLQREEGWRAAVAQAGLAVLEPIRPPTVPEPGPNPTDADREARARCYLGFLFDRLRGPMAPDALLAVNDTHAIAVMQACRLLGLAVHQQIAVAGFDGNWSLLSGRGAGAIPPILSATKHNHRVGEALVAVLNERLARGPGGPPVQRLMPVEVVRPDTGRPG
jgi:DNA-binding LacI/PurR family transcriptional regulator